jgi:hypothetical protein
MPRNRAKFWTFAMTLMTAGLILDHALPVAIIANVAALLLYETGELSSRVPA